MIKNSDQFERTFGRRSTLSTGHFSDRNIVLYNKDNYEIQPWLNHGPLRVK